MSNKNYTRYSKMSGEEPMLVNEVAVEVQPDPVVDENESASIEQPIEGQTVIPEVEPIAEPEPTVEPEIRKFGRVHGCKKLNVRKLPNQDAKILIELVEGAEVMIDDKSSTAMFYKVCTECGIDGYCMKKFIKVLQ